MAQEETFFEVDDERVIEDFNSVIRLLRDPRPFLEEAGAVIVSSIQKNFDVGGRYSDVGDWRGGTRRWRPLSVLTLFGSLGKRGGKFFKKRGGLKKRGERRLSGKKILVAEGHLMGSINFEVRRDALVIGTNLPYAAIHQFGGKAGRGHGVRIPARPYLVIQDEDLEEIRNIGNDYLLGSV